MRDTREFRYVVDAQDRIISANGHWFDFAFENGAHGLKAETLPGRSLWDFILDRETKLLYQVLLKAVRERGEAKSLPYRCDSADRRRFMELTISNSGGGSVLFRSRMIREEYREKVPLLAENVVRSDCLIVMCSWCKKVRVRPEEWLEVEQAVKELGLFSALELPRISHGICDRCKSEMAAYSC